MEHVRQTGDGAWQSEQRGAVGGTRDVGFKGKVGRNIKKNYEGSHASVREERVLNE